SVSLHLSEVDSQALAVLAQGAMCTMNVVVQAAWAYVLHRYSGESSVVFGTTVSGRPAHLPGVERMMGLLIHTVPSRVEFDGTQTVREVLRQIQRDNAARDDYSYLSLPEILGQCNARVGSELFDTLLVFESYPMQIASGGGGAMGAAPALGIERVSTHEGTTYGLTLVAAHDGRLGLTLQHHPQRS